MLYLERVVHHLSAELRLNPLGRPIDCPLTLSNSKPEFQEHRLH